jgi:glycosyltransferase involved in cell wall biosynthesis
MADRQAVLIIAYAYPPDHAVGAARPYRFAKYLRRLGYSPHVLTATPPNHTSPSDVHYVADRFSAPGWRAECDLKSARIEGEAERVIRKFLLPGEAGLIWARDAAAVCQRFLDDSSRTTLISTFPPIGTHLCAWLLKRRQNLRWIADFRDPLTNNPSRAHGGLPKRIDALLEAAIFRRADVIIANTDSAAERWSRSYPANKGKIHVIWNGFDPEDGLGPLPISDNACKVIAHVGHLYRGRAPGPLLASLARLFEQGRVPPGGVRMRIAGPVEGEHLADAAVLQQLAASGGLELTTELVPAHQARRIIQEAGGLLLIQPQSRLQVPSKLFDYVRIGRPVLAFIPRTSPIEHILSQSGIRYCCVYPDDPPATMDERLMEFLRLPTEALRPSAWFESRFNALEQARILSALL